MQSLRLFFVLAMAMALAITLSTSAPLSEQESFLNNGDAENATESSDREPTSIRGAGRFLAESSSRGASTCDKRPKVCLRAGSPGPYCCNKKCVDIKTDKYNCGRCGKKCNYAKICCQGKCVNPLSNEQHCGGCNNNCGNGNSCVYGMCSYA